MNNFNDNQMQYMRIAEQLAETFRWFKLTITAAVRCGLERQMTCALFNLTRTRMSTADEQNRD